jgi:hypothetical protein
MRTGASGRRPMTTQRRTGSRATTTTFAIAIVLLASSCGQSTSSANQTPSVVPSSPPAATPSPSPPPGGPVPAQLLGDWFLSPADSAAYIAANEGSTCSAPPTATNCVAQLTLMATTYQEVFTFGGSSLHAASGNVVVNNNEIDFFNEVNTEGTSMCDVPGGVGRYKWSLAGGVLHFTLISEPCGGTQVLANHRWSQKH